MLSNDEIASLIGPYEAHIRDATLGAWAKYSEDPNRQHYCSRTRANIIWDFATNALEASLDPMPGVHVDRSINSCMFMIGQKLAFRFKKADENGMSSNYPTPMALAFHDPEQLVLGIPEAVKAELVYVLNKLETEVEQIRMVRRSGGNVTWTHTIYQRAKATVAEFATNKTAENQSTKKSRVKVKESATSTTTITPSVKEV